VHTRLVSTSWTHTFSNEKVNQLIFGYARINNSYHECADHHGRRFSHQPARPAIFHHGFECRVRLCRAPHHGESRSGRLAFGYASGSIGSRINAYLNIVAFKPRR